MIDTIQNFRAPEIADTDVSSISLKTAETWRRMQFSSKSMFFTVPVILFLLAFCFDATAQSDTLHKQAEKAADMTADTVKKRRMALNANDIYHDVNSCLPASSLRGLSAVQLGNLADTYKNKLRNIFTSTYGWPDNAYLERILSHARDVFLSIIQNANEPVFL